jgi:hypothetical protein
MLDAERWTLYGAKLNPHFKFVDHQSWLARKDGRIAGRIFAQIYKDGIVPVEASAAQFGCVDSIEDEAVLASLLDTAETWLKQRGAKLIHGPFSPSINAECGMLVEGFDAAPMVFTPWNPPYLPQMLEKHGYVKAQDLVSYRYDVSARDHVDDPGMKGRLESRSRLKIRTIEYTKAEAALVVDIFNDGWSENWGFVPFTFEEFWSIAEVLKHITPPEGGFMIELDGVPQAFGIILPNMHEITADLDGRLFPFGLAKVITRIRRHKFKSGRLALLGIRRALHRKAAGGAIIIAFIAECRRRSRTWAMQRLEFGWVLEHNMGMRRPIELAGARLDKIHRIYEKRLDT